MEQVKIKLEHQHQQRVRTNFSSAASTVYNNNKKDIHMTGVVMTTVSKTETVSMPTVSSVAMATSGGSNVGNKPRKLNFTLAEVECLLKCVLRYRDVVLFSVQGGRGDVSNKNSPWLQTWERIARVVTSVERIARTEADCRKKWTYLKWEARNTSKPTRDPVSKCVYEILTAGEGEAVDIDLVVAANGSPGSNTTGNLGNTSRNLAVVGGATSTGVNSGGNSRNLKVAHGKLVTSSPSSSMTQGRSSSQQQVASLAKLSSGSGTTHQVANSSGQILSSLFGQTVGACLLGATSATTDDDDEEDLVGGVSQPLVQLPVLVKIERNSADTLGETYPALLCRSVLMDNSKASVSSNIKPSTSSTPRVANIAPASNSAAIQQQQQQRQHILATSKQQQARSTVANSNNQPCQPPESPPVLVPIPGMQQSSSPPLLSLSQDVCLRWNSYHSNMQQSFPMLLDTEQFVDVTLACEGQFIKCHKMVLSACSSFFAELFQQNPCSHPVIVLRGSRMWEIRALVDFMYRGEVNVQQDRLASLLAAAEELQVKGLAGSTTKIPDNISSPEHSSYNLGGHSTDEGHKYQTSLQHKKILKRKAAYPQYNEPRAVRPAPQPQSFPKMRIKPRSFASMIPEHFEDSDTKTTKKKSRTNHSLPNNETENNQSRLNQNISDEIVRVKEECLDFEDHDKNFGETLSFNEANCTMDNADNTDNNIDDDYGSSKYSDDNNKLEIDPLEVDDERNEIEDNIEEAYD